MSTQSQFSCILIALGPKGSDKGFDGLAYTHPYYMIISMIVAEEVGVRRMKENFETKTSTKSTIQIQKNLNLFGNKDYQAARDELGMYLLGREYIDMLSTYNVIWDIRQHVLGYLMFRRENNAEKWKGEDVLMGVHNENNMSQKKN